MKLALLSHRNVLHLKLPRCIFTFIKSLKIPSPFSLLSLPGSKWFWMCKRLPVGTGLVLYLMEFNGIKRRVTNSALSLYCIKQWNKAWSLRIGSSVLKRLWSTLNLLLQMQERIKRLIPLMLYEPVLQTVFIFYLQLKKLGWEKMFLFGSLSLHH